MQIAYILASLSADYGGPPHCVRGLGRRMAELGAAVSYWAPARPGDAPAGAHERLFPAVAPYGWYRSPQLRAALEKELDAIDLLHLQEVWSYPQWAAGRLARQQRKPYLITPHGVLEPWRLKRRGLARRLKKNLYLAALGRTLLNRAACLHAITPGEVEGLRRAGYRGPVTIIPNGVEVAPFMQLPARAAAEERWPELKNRFAVLFLSRLSSEKGLDALLPAWQLLRDSQAPLLVLAGPDDKGYRAVVEALIERYELAGRVLLTGAVHGADKMKLLARADAYTLPSHSEGFSISLLEALAAGLPALITPGCNFPEAAACGAGICADDQPAALAAGFRELLRLSAAQRAEMGRRGRRLIAENYTWELAARKMFRVYQALLAGNVPPENPAP